MDENWLPVVGLEGFFEVSDLGRIRTVGRMVRFLDKRGAEQFRLKAPKIVATQKINSGYIVVHMSANRVRRARTVHSVVAEAFIGPRPKGLDVCHNNGDRLDNRAGNLRYDTRSNNQLDRIVHGTIYDSNTAAKLSVMAVQLIRDLNDGSTGYIKRMAEISGVTESTIRRVIRRKAWKYVG